MLRQNLKTKIENEKRPQRETIQEDKKTKI